MINMSDNTKVSNKILSRHNKPYFKRFQGELQKPLTIHIFSVYNKSAMNGLSDKYYKRVNITLPQETFQLIAHIAERGDRSRFINEAVHFYVRKIKKTYLRKQLQEGAHARSARDLNIVQEWFPLENEIWRKDKK